MRGRRPTATRMRSATTDVPSARWPTRWSPSDSTRSSAVPVRTSMPSCSSDRRTLAAASGVSRASTRSAASTIVTCEPKRASAWPSSQPIGPPPSTRRRRGSSASCQTVSEVSGSLVCSPGRSGTTGDDPVVSSAWSNVTSTPPTSARPGPANLTVPWATATPDSRRCSGESIGAILAIEACTCAITVVKSTDTESTWTPSRSPSRASAATCAAASSDLLGTHPVQRQSPPVRSRSTSRTWAPKPAAVWAATSPAVPPPTISRSQGRRSSRCSGSDDHTSAVT